MEKKDIYVNDESDDSGTIQKVAYGEVLEMDSTSKEEVIFSTEEKERIYEFLANTENLSDVLDEDPDYIINKLPELDFDKAMEILMHSKEYYNDDANFPELMMERLVLLTQGQEASGLDDYYYDLEVRLQAAVIHFHSPYPEVRAVVRPTDDTSVLCETYRAYLVGLFWVCGASFINTMFGQRQPTITLNATVLQVLIYPSGELLQRLPHKTISIFGYKWNLNPGPWTFKEQMLATIMTNVGAGTSNWLQYGLVMRLPIFFNNDWVQYGFLFLMAFYTNVFGFGLAGVLRRYVVYPTKAMWPTVLPIMQLNKTLLMPEVKQSINGWTLSKYKLFWTTFAAMFLYFFIPDYLFTALSTFNWMTWIAPHNKKLAFLTGSKIGMGLNPWTTWDWSVINYTTPLVLPFFATVNKYAGMVIGAFVIIGLYFSNYHYTAYFPPNTSTMFDHNASKYNLTKILRNGVFDEDLYKSYSQVYIGAGYMTLLGSYYCLYTCAFTYVFLTEWKMVYNGVKGFIANIKNRKLSNYENFNDPFSNTMRKYKEVPDWWFILTLIVGFCVGVGAIVGYPTHCPVWALVVVILVSFCMAIPTTVMFSGTGYLMAGDTLTVIIAGYMVQGNPLANLICRVTGYNTDEQAESFIGDMKIGHYARLPPRAVFRAQMIATFLQSLITTGAMKWLIDNTVGFCTSTQSARLVCAGPNTLYNNTILLGVIGPKRTYDTMYPILKYGFLMGLGTGLLFVALRWKFTRFMKNIHPVIILSGITRYGQTYNLSYYTPGLYFSWFFMYYLRRHYLAWWTKYNYILSSGLTAGMAFSGILIFFALQYTSKTVKWWGNSVSSAGVDGKGVATLLDVPEGGFAPW